MILDLTTITASVKDQLTEANEKADSKRITRALNNCLDDLATRLATSGVLTSYSVTLAANSRTYTVQGEAEDFHYLFALKFGSGDQQKTLDYVDPDQFLLTYDNPSATAGVPFCFTILTNDQGDPVAKFNCPTSVSDTLVIYYSIDLTGNNIAQLRSGACVVAGTLAWFWGIADGRVEAASGQYVPGRGERSYRIYLELSKLMRSSDHFIMKNKPRVGINSFDRSVREIQGNIRNRRS